jgi:hypothetical protein
MAAHAETVDEPAEVAKALNMIPAKFPEYVAFPIAETRGVTNFPSDPHSDIRP